MTKESFRLDAGESAFFTRQLESIKTRTYDVKHSVLKATTLLPVSTEANSGATSITYRSYDAVGVAKIVADYAHDFPRVDVYGTEKSVKVKSLGAMYGYSIKEIRSAQMAGVPLDQRRANAARRAIDELVDKLAWVGDAAAGINGFVNYPGITEYTVVADGTGATKTWATKTPDQIVRDVTGLINSVISVTNGREIPDTLLLPISQYNIIANTRMTGNSDKTILTFILENSPYLRSVEWVTELTTAGAGGTARMMVYPRDPEHVTLEMPQMFEMFPPQPKAMEFEVPCHAETAGVIVYYPQSVAFGDGI